MLTSKERTLLYINNIGILGFSIFFILQKNYEFLIYIITLIIATYIIFKSHKVINYPLYALAGMLIWGFLHMAGGSIAIENGKVLYEKIIFNLVRTPYNIFKYDQLVHFWGFGFATIICFYILKHITKGSIKNKIAILFLSFNAGTGLGAFNEVVEFITFIITKTEGVGGYYNTSIDLLVNLLGALSACVFLYYKELKNT